MHMSVFVSVVVVGVHMSVFVCVAYHMLLLRTLPTNHGWLRPPFSAAQPGNDEEPPRTAKCGKTLQSCGTVL